MSKLTSINLFGAVFVALSIGSTATVHAAEKGKFSDSQICKASVATIMGRNPAIMNDRSKGEIIYLSYKRADDGKKFAYKCKLEGNKIIWGSDTGPWRTHAMDSKITFNVKGDTVHIKELFSDGSSNKKSYTLQQVGK